MNKTRVVEIVEKIIRHVYIAGRFNYPYNDGPYIAGKAFHLARACDLTNSFVNEFEDNSIARDALLKALEQSKIIVQAYYERDNYNKPKSLDLLVDFLMDNICHHNTTASIMEHFAVEKCPSILTEESRKEGRHSLAWLSEMVASLGVDTGFVTSDT